jgi:hypothetical protein
MRFLVTKLPAAEKDPPDSPEVLATALRSQAVLLDDASLVSSAGFLPGHYSIGTDFRIAHFNGRGLARDGSAHQLLTTCL